jgi:tetratricopeptide (TPR) repeat protein
VSEERAATSEPTTAELAAAAASPAGSITLNTVHSSQGVNAPAATFNGPINTFIFNMADSRPSPAAGERIIVGSVSAPLGRLPQVLRGRHTESDALASIGEKQRIKILVGMGGVGKSTLALSYAARCRDEGVEVLWVSASSRERFISSLRQVALVAGVPAGAVEDLWRLPERPAADVLWEHLASWQREWLLVFDNADDLEVLACQDSALGDLTGWVRPPVGGGRGVVVTTRDRARSAWGRAAAQVIDIDVLRPEDGAAILLDLAPSAGPLGEAQMLGEAVGGLPLALVLAGSYLAAAADDPFAEARSFADYRRLLSRSPVVLDSTALERPADLRDEDSRARETIARTWELSLALLERRGLGEARPLLQVLSCFAPSVPLPAAMISPEVIASVWNGAPVDAPAAADLLRGLHRFGLLNVVDTGNGPEYELHRLVAELSVQPMLDTPEYHGDLWRAATRMLAAASPEESRDPATWPTWQAIAPHWLRALSHLPIPTVEAILCGCLVQSYLRSRGNYAQAREVGARLLTLTDMLDETGDLRSAVRYHNALTARDLGDLALAESEMRAVARQYEAAGQSAAQPAVAARYEMGTILGRRGKSTEAEQVLREVLVAETATYGPLSREVLLTRHDLLVVLRALGRYEEVAAEISELCEQFEITFGPDNIDTLACWHEYAIALRDMHDLDAALAMFQRVYETECEILGEDHPSALTTRSSIASTMRLLGRTDDADEELHTILQARTRLLGKDHPDTLLTRRELVAVGVGTGTLSYADAEDELRRILSADGVQLAREHQTIVAGLTDLGAVQLARGKQSLALETLQTALEAAVREYDYNHPQTALIRVQLADLFSETGMHDEAINEYRAVLVAQRSAVGHFHINSLNVEERIGVSLLKAGRASEAYEAFRDAAAGLAQRYGTAHPETLAALQATATAQMLLGRREEALELLHSVLAQQLMVEGRSSDQVRDTRNNLALTLRECGRLEEALAQYDEALASILPDESSGATALSIRHNRAVVLRLMGRADEAEHEYRSILTLQLGQGGPRSPGVLETRHGIARVLESTGRWRQAEAEYRDVLRLRCEVLGPAHLATLTTQNCLAFLMSETGRHREAQQMYKKALSALTKTVGIDHPETMRTIHNYAWVNQRRGNLKRAEEGFREVVASRRRVLGRADVETLTSEFELVNCLRRQGRSAEAIAPMRANLDVATSAFGPESELALRARLELAAALAEIGSFDDARHEIHEASLLARKSLPSGHIIRQEIASTYAGILKSSHR